MVLVDFRPIDQGRQRIKKFYLLGNPLFYIGKHRYISKFINLEMI